MKLQSHLFITKINYIDNEHWFLRKEFYNKTFNYMNNGQGIKYWRDIVLTVDMEMNHVRY